tara:strand:+ start:9900 stop:10124 length:225 start_codon:yes stop_codon:yes gene_type:complete
MVNNVQFESDLAQFGQVEAIGENNSRSYIIVISGVTATAAQIDAVATTHLSSDYSIKRESTLVDGLFKSIWVKD